MKLKQILATALVLALVIPQAGFAETKLSDISGNANEKAIKELEAQNILQGTPEGKFNPNKELSRAEAAVMFVKAFYEKDEKKIAAAVEKEQSFSDVAGDHWANAYLKYAKMKGIMAGYPDGTAKPDKPVTKEEMLALALAAKKVNLDEVKKAADWKAAVTQRAQQSNLLLDTEKDASANRAFAAQVVYNAIQKSKKKLNPATANEATFPIEKLKYGELKFSDAMDKYGDMPIASDVKVFTYGESKNYKADMKLPEFKDLEIDTIYKYKDAKAKAFYIEENGKITYMLLPKDAGFTGAVYCVVNDTHIGTAANGEKAEVIDSLTAGKPISWSCESGVILQDATKYKNGNFVKLLVSDGVVHAIVPLLANTEDFKVLTKITAGESKFETVTEVSKGVIKLGDKYIGTKDAPTVYQFKAGKYKSASLGSVTKGTKVKAFDITDDKEESADLLIIK